MRELFTDLTADQADTCGLVLSASGISYRVKRRRTGWEIWVQDADYDAALASVKQYLQENRHVALENGTETEPYQKNFSGVWVSLVLLAWYLIYLTGTGRQMFIRAYGAASDAILHGELYRIVTALMLHADPVHLTGNMVGVAVFGTAVCGTMGVGVGWFMILLTGILHLMGEFRIARFIKGKRTTAQKFLAVFEIVLGGLLIYSPLDRSPVVYWIATAWALIGGSLIIADAIYSSRNASREQDGEASQEETVS